MLVCDRESKLVCNDNQYGAKVLNFLYNNAFGRIILKFVINPIFSRICGWYNNTSLSKVKINKWVKKYGIDLSKFEKSEFKSFNEFFARKLKEDNEEIADDLFISPVEAKLMVYNISKDLKLNIKNSIYTLDELFKNKIDVSEYKNGLCFVYHLTVDCYHRYCHIDSGKRKYYDSINGVLHTVSSISKDYKIYKENERTFSVLETDNFGEIIYMEVGALVVGKIINEDIENFTKGQEKGHFELGGSTVIIFIKDKSVIVDNDILENSKKNIETKVKYKEVIGKKYFENIA